MNMVLDAKFSADEIRHALFQMHPTKAPGVDGLPALFFQKYWSIVGDGVVAACLGCLNDGLPMQEVNSTLITLIPKKERPREVSDFRPISLCTSVYKIIAKTIANRFRSVLGDVISESQSAFIPGRLITDNALIGFECMHLLKRKKLGDHGFAALKLDMSKAYDRVEWSYLESIMRRLGFSASWVDLILRCVSSVSYSFVVNGEVFGRVQPSRGLRQGDPLSPYLFIICSEGLSGLVSAAESDGRLLGLRCGRYGPRISHLFFADDSLLFFRASSIDCSAVGSLLDFYSEARLLGHEMELLLVLLWRFWFRRNRAVHSAPLLSLALWHQPVGVQFGDVPSSLVPLVVDDSRGLL
ncbi:hypothetical protein ACOSQ2_031384 [Xanthoceras sorbifolium]